MRVLGVGVFVCVCVCFSLSLSLSFQVRFGVSLSYDSVAFVGSRSCIAKPNWRSGSSLALSMVLLIAISNA